MILFVHQNWGAKRKYNPYNVYIPNVNRINENMQNNDFDLVGDNDIINSIIQKEENNDI